jgi:hypothetical protein
VGKWGEEGKMEGSKMSRKTAIISLTKVFFKIQYDDINTFSSSSSSSIYHFNKDELKGVDFTIAMMVTIGLNCRLFMSSSQAG